MSNKRPIIVEVRARYDNEPIEKMVKRFIKKVKKSRIIETFLEKKSYEKPSDKRKRLKKRRQKVLEKLNKLQQRTIDK